MIGVVIGPIVAVLPGIGTVQTIALLLPLTLGVLGYLMMLFDYPRITLVIALTLGELTERSIHQSMGISNGNWEIFVHNRRIPLCVSSRSAKLSDRPRPFQKPFQIVVFETVRFG